MSNPSQNPAKKGILRTHGRSILKAIGITLGFAGLFFGAAIIGAALLPAALIGLTGFVIGGMMGGAVFLEDYEKNKEHRNAEEQNFQRGSTSTILQGTEYQPSANHEDNLGNSALPEIAPSSSKQSRSKPSVLSKIFCCFHRKANAPQEAPISEDIAPALLSGNRSPR